MASNAFTRIWFALSRLRRATNGNVAVIVAFTLPVVVGGAGLGVETSFWYYSSLKLQAVADAAAYAGALEKVAGSDNPTIIAAATQSATSNNFATPGTIQVNTPPLSGPNTAKKAVPEPCRQPILSPAWRRRQPATLARMSTATRRRKHSSLAPTVAA
ncbi:MULTISPECIES: pilus assembly protein TadG-related protein [unclassified Mesorhizobium]|nr:MULTISPECIES: pilus assembly protein TadG-related protein [unclassified Mesorhizobium]ESX40113.1 hypothetical protein X763_07305 [Mesorhizobium sp. LSHC432A00]